MSDPVDFLTGRALHPGYTADTAPDGMRWVYDALAPAPGTQYGDVLPIKREADGRLGFAMPNVMREGLLGVADLLSGTETGELTGRGAQSITMGGLGAGMTMAPRGALAVGGARNDPRMDLQSRMERARAMGFRTDRPLYHGTDAPKAFESLQALAPWEAVRAAWPPGIWLAEQPPVANKFAEEGSRSRLGLSPTSPHQSRLQDPAGTRVLPLLARYDNPVELLLPDRPRWGDVWHDVSGLFWDGKDAVKLLNYTNFPDLGPQTIWAIREPNQLRSLFARFDPAKRNSDDLMAGFAAPAPVGFNVRETPPPGFRFDPALVPNELRRPQDRVY